MVSLGDIWSFVQGSKARVPTNATIPAERVLDPIRGPQVVEPGTHYFVIQVDRIFLESKRRWLREIDPLVLAISEYRYGREPVRLPFVIGPSLLGDRASEVPQGMLYTNTRVAGIHPYRGGQLVLAMILCRTTRTNYARRLVGLVEGLAGAVPFGEELGTYTRLADNLLDSIDALFGVGDTEPLVGVRTEFDHDILGQEIRPMYAVLIDDDDARRTIDRLWVKGGDLMIGDGAGDLRPFRDASYVLYSVRGVDRLSSIASLPLTAGDIEIRRLMRSDKEENRELGRARLLDLWDSLLASPDVTEADAKAHLDDLLAKIEQDRRLAGRLTLSAGSDRRTPDEDEDEAVLAARRTAIDRIRGL